MTAAGRTVVIVAALVLVFVADPAGAHVCALPVQTPVGEPAVVSIGVGAEAVTVTEVDITVPEGFRLADAGADGWRAEVEGNTVRFVGGPVEPFTCDYVTLRGVAEERAVLAFPLELRTVEGDSVVYDGLEPYREDSAQLVYAGLELPELLPEEDGGADPLEVAGWALLAAALVLGAIWGAVRWRSGSTTAAAP